jgi:6-pyruvoyltetrahydropterin/6-carboxytetrahydropterin synthase
MGSFELIIQSEFSAAHRLRLPDGTYEPLHGHNWQVEAHLAGTELDASGMLADFTIVQPALAAVTAELHNTCLNELPAFRAESPSTERVARYIHDRLAPQMPKLVTIRLVRVWETSQCAAAYLPGDR